MGINKQKMVMKAFVRSQFAYCPLMWIVELWTYDKQTHKGALKVVYEDYHDLKFQELLDKSVSGQQNPSATWSWYN